MTVSRVVLGSAELLGQSSRSVGVHKSLSKFTDLREQWRVSKQVFPLTPAEEQAVKGVRRKIDGESSPSEGCAFKRRRDVQFHPSPFERSFATVGPLCSQIGDGMDLS
ncbi:hypothetical protein RJ639_001087 [Escallonia herrerae]|uniref:Uncharacterized protein n=1 Tax=Escallonia herrerae TaxID=1293975 RepID=A0AA88XDX2_9ASTE|nr:hypothetical protein RJ639_001087 [Escallonia herrerae]